MTKKLLFIVGLGLIIGISYSIWRFMMPQVNEPYYTVVKKMGQFEIRHYPAFLVAEVFIDNKDRQQAINEGFRALFKYIDKNNAKKQAIPMTAPVLQQPYQSGFKVAFVMPANETLFSLPQAQTANITFKEVANQKFLVLRFSGSSKFINFDQKLVALETFAEKEHIELSNEIYYAFYNPPWTLPFLKRNEIMRAIS